MSQQHELSLRKLISVYDARLLLGGIGRTKLYELIGNGDLQTVKLGRRTLFFEAEVVAFSESLPRGAST